MTNPASVGIFGDIAGCIFEFFSIRAIPLNILSATFEFQGHEIIVKVTLAKNGSVQVCVPFRHRLILFLFFFTL